MGKLGVGVLGVGGMGRRHAENLRHLALDAELVAVADADLPRAQAVAAELGIERAFGSFDAMLEEKAIQAVVIASPDRFHAEGIRAAAAAGKDILCEKPLALNLEDALQALAAVERAGVRLQIGFMRRYDPAYARARARIEAGEIGEPVVFKSIGRDRLPPPIEAYQGRLNGMLFLNSTIHDFDLARWLMGDEVAEVSAFGTTAIRPEVAEHGDIVAGVVNLKYRRGAIGNVESYVQCLYGYDVRTEIAGSKGSIMIGSQRSLRATILKPEGSLNEIPDHFLSYFADAYVAEILDFVRCIRDGGAPRVTGEDGLRALRTSLAAQDSLRRQAPSFVAV